MQRVRDIGSFGAPKLHPLVWRMAMRTRQAMSDDEQANTEIQSAPSR
jgi:hypothetical protein